MKPARLSARTRRSPDMLGSLAIGDLVSDFYKRPKGLLRGVGLWGAPGFQVHLDGFAKVGPRGFDILALRGNTQFRAPGDIPVVFFRDQSGEAVVHSVMLTEVGSARK